MGYAQSTATDELKKILSKANRGKVTKIYIKIQKRLTDLSVNRLTLFVVPSRIELLSKV